MRVHAQSLLVLVLAVASNIAGAYCSYYLSANYACLECRARNSNFTAFQNYGGRCFRCELECPIVALNKQFAAGADKTADKMESAGQVCGQRPTGEAQTALFYAVQFDRQSIVELAKVAPIAAHTLAGFSARPAIDPIDMRHGVGYFSIQPNAASVTALLDGSEARSMELARPLAADGRLRVIYRSLDHSSDDRITMTIEAVGDTKERTTVVELEKIRGAVVQVNAVNRQAPVYRIIDISFIE